MNTYTFIKSNGKWFIDLNDNTTAVEGNNAMMAAGADTILNLLSAGENTVMLTLNTEPFENADVLELLQLCHPFLKGGYYSLRQHDGKDVNYNMWLYDVPQRVFGQIPQKIYVRKEMN